MDKNIQEYIHSAAEFFFFFLGFSYAIGYLLKTNNVLVVEYEYFVALSDNAFVFSALCYFFLSMIIKSEKNFFTNRLDDNEVKDFFPQKALFSVIGVIIFLAYFILDLTS